MPGRFFLGVGTGENLNEHILGDHSPLHDLRLAMLEDAVDVIRLLWQGGTQTHRGCYYILEALFAANLNRVYSAVALKALEVYAISTSWLRQDTVCDALGLDHTWYEWLAPHKNGERAHNP